MKTWLKGGLIGSIVGIIGTLMVHLLGMAILPLQYKGLLGNLGSNIFAILTYLFLFIGIMIAYLRGIPYESMWMLIPAVAINAILYFCIGALIGLLVRRIKSKKNSRT